MLEKSDILKSKDFFVQLKYPEPFFPHVLSNETLVFSSNRMKYCHILFVTLKDVTEMQSLQKPATTLMMKNGIQHNRKTPMIMPIVIAA